MNDILTIIRDYEKLDVKTRPAYDDYIRQCDPELADALAETKAQRLAELEANRAWEPTEEFLHECMTNKGWPTFDRFTYDHLETEEERVSLQTAVSLSEEFASLVKEGRGVSMIVIASAVGTDLERTGYGCGKTMLAQCIHYKNSVTRWARDLGKDSAHVMPSGRFFEARELMAIFDKDDYNPAYGFGNFGNLVVIDDVGREGSLRWERRDPDLQLQEKQGRYYNVINHCYEKGISVVITSNLSSRELAVFLGGATWSRLLQMCPKKFRVNMTGIRDIRPLLADSDWP